MGKDSSVTYMYFKKDLKDNAPDRYVHELSACVITEFDKDGKSNGLGEILKAIAKDESDEPDSQVLFSVALSFYKASLTYGARQTARDFLIFLFESAGWGPNYDGNEKLDGRGSGFFARKSSRGADRNQTLVEADQIKRDAQTAAAQIKKTAEDEAEEVKRRADEEAKWIKREANAILEDARKNARTQADKAYEAEKADFVPRAISELVEQYRRDDAEAYRRSDEQRVQLCRDLEKIHADVCDQVKALQANINETLNNTRNELCDDLTHWREDFYKKEVDELAACCVDLRKMLNNLDRQLGEARALSDQPGQTDRLPGSVTAPAKGMSAQQFAEQLDKILINLNKFDKKLRNAVLGVGLDVYIPVEGDRLDPAQHALENGEEERMAGREIASCRTPGVRRLQPGGSSRSFEPLIRAEVTLKQEGSW